MATHQSNPNDFISLLSSEDEAPLTRKRKYSDEEPASVGRQRASAGRFKRARATSASGDSVAGAKASEKGEVDIGVPGLGTNGDKKETGRFVPGSVFVPKSPPIFAIHSISLQLPVFSRQREGTWLNRFTEWVQLLCSTNMDSPSAAEITPALIRAAYQQYVDVHSRLKSNKKRAARLVARQFQDSALLDLIRAFRPLQHETTQLTAAVEETLEETLAEPNIRFDAPRPQTLPPQTQTPPAAVAPLSRFTEQSSALYIIDVAPQLPQTANMSGSLSHRVSQPASQPKHLQKAQRSSTNLATMSLRSAVPSGAEAREQQQRYFPSAKNPFNMCLLCGREGHAAEKCITACRFCGETGHWDCICPSWELECTNCWRYGHSEEACWYPKRDGHWCFCGVCDSPDHRRRDCMTLHRSFHPDEKTIKKVNALPVSCAACGSEEHFHKDCRRDGGPVLPYDSKFHLDNMRRYLDPTSSSGPIVGTDACRGAPKAGGFRICGRALASPVDNVCYYSGSDDSDEGLHHIFPRHHHRLPSLGRKLTGILDLDVEVEVAGVVEVAAAVARMVQLHKMAELLKMYRDIRIKMCKVAKVYKVVKTSKPATAAEVNGVNEVAEALEAVLKEAKMVKMDRDIKEAHMYTMSKLIKVASMAQVNRTVRRTEAKGGGEVAKRVKRVRMARMIRMVTREAQVYKLLKVAKVNKTVRENGLQDGDEVDEVAEGANFASLMRLGNP
ncbi:hypothetical protein J3F83DRAFT_758603 [Trichoderma novae-zelandiae]